MAKMTDIEFNDCLNQWNKSDGHKEFWEALRVKYGYKSVEAIRSKFKRERKKRGITKSEVEVKQIHNESMEMKNDGTIISDRLIQMSDEESKSPQRLLELHNLDPELFELYNVKNNLWHMAGGEEGLRLHYQSKITAKPKSFIWDKESIDKMLASLSTKSLKIPKPKQYKQNGLAALLEIVDLHYGLSAKKDITGSDYNRDIARDRVYKYIQQAKKRLSGIQLEKIFLHVGNDFFNSDNLRGTTTKGTEQDTFDFWYDLFDGGVEIIATVIMELSEIAPVEIRWSKSNHDVHTMYTVMKLIEEKFKGLYVDTSPMMRKYLVFGNNLLGFSHNIKRLKDAQALMATEAKDEWAKCDYRYWFLAHLHNQMMYESQGNLEIHRLPPFCERSRWTTNQAYIQDRRKGLVYIFDKQEGIIDTKNIYL